MNRKITEQRFNEIKEFLDTPILVKPPIRYVAESFGYSSGTIAKINRFNTHKEYLDYERERQKKYTNDYLENEMNFSKAEAEQQKKEIEEFNNEWYFKNES